MTTIRSNPGTRPAGPPSQGQGPSGPQPFGRSRRLDSSALGGLKAVASGQGQGQLTAAPRQGSALQAMGKLASSVGAATSFVPIPQLRVASGLLQAAGAGLTAVGQGASGKQALMEAGKAAVGSVLPGRLGAVAGTAVTAGLEGAQAALGGASPAQAIMQTVGTAASSALPLAGGPLGKVLSHG
jgi:hypothetical protein